MVRTYETDYAGRKLSIEIGKMARQAGGSCTLRYGDTVVLVTACRANSAIEGRDFMPLTVNYQEMTYAAGKIPGGFFKREGRPSTREVLISRLIDRPLRPLFPKGYAYETQVIATALSVDHKNDAELISLIGASVALGISDIPFSGPIAAYRIGAEDGKYIENPSLEQQKSGDLDLIVAGGEGSIIMVEGGARFVTEDFVVKALNLAEEGMKGIIDLQKRIFEDYKPEKLPVPLVEVADELRSRVEEKATPGLKECLVIPDKLKRYAAIDALKKEIMEELAEEFEGRESEISQVFGEAKHTIMRDMIVKEKKRVDGRGPRDIRDITCEVGFLPRTHGSALFTRGETQALVNTTLGTSEDEQKIDALSGWEYKRFMLHYNFPPFCVGEVKFLRSPGRREIGHGALAERAIKPVFPGSDDFPYTVRVVSDILESNGSSSMATVCGASLSLMDAGVPIKCHIAGIAMGLIKEGDETVVLSDILGDEDHLGDMDFKVAGSDEGITALQMDIKISGVTSALLTEALAQARDGRLHILGKMNEVITEPRKEISSFAPRIITLMVKPERIKDVIGPGGKNIKGIILETGVKMDVDDTGKVSIASNDEEAAQRAIKMVKELTQEAEVGKIYTGTVRKIMDFGAFIEILPKTDGLCHISELADERVRNVTDILKEGDKVRVKVLNVDRSGKIKLSRKAALHEEKDGD